jgi:hypothetical protein
MSAEEDYERFKALADELEMEDDAAQKFIDSAMKRKGHKPVTSWADAEPKAPEGGEGDFFGNRRKKEAAAAAAAEGKGDKGEKKVSGFYE